MCHTVVCLHTFHGKYDWQCDEHLLGHVANLLNADVNTASYPQLAGLLGEGLLWLISAVVCVHKTIQNYIKVLHNNNIWKRHAQQISKVTPKVLFSSGLLCLWYMWYTDDSFWISLKCRFKQFSTQHCCSSLSFCEKISPFDQSLVRQVKYYRTVKVVCLYVGNIKYWTLPSCVDRLQWITWQC